MDTLVYGVGAAISGLLNVLLLPVYAHVFAPAAFGVIALVTSAMALLNSFVPLALDSGTARWYWDTEDERDRKQSVATWFWTQTIVSVTVTALIFLLADPLSDALVGSASAAKY